MRSRSSRPASSSVNLDTKTVEVDGARVHLTGKEYQMLELLSLRKGTTLTKEMFLNHLYGGMDEPELKIIDVFICKLRKKLANASQRQELHRDGVGPRLRAARADRGRGAHSGVGRGGCREIQGPALAGGVFVLDDGPPAFQGSRSRLGCVTAQQRPESRGSFNMIATLLGLIVLVLDIWAIVKVVQSGASTGAKVLWVLLILILPVVGLIIWYLAGPK